MGAGPRASADHATVSHAVVKEVLTSNDFRAGVDVGGAPGPIGQLHGWGAAEAPLGWRQFRSGPAARGPRLDPDVFADPHRFDVTRENAAEHVSFSAGRHYCLGAALARMEGEVGLRRLFERCPDLTLVPGARRRPTRVLRGFEYSPARLTR